MKPQDMAMVAVRCPDCGHVVEAEVEGGQAVLSPELVRMHEDCAVDAVLGALNAAIRDLSQYI